MLLILNLFNITAHAQVNNAVAIYSLRLLNSSYQGAAITVRNGSNNETRNIRFYNGYLDTVQLKSFIGNASAYVTKWFDQSGFERNAAQVDLVKQPRIMNAGIFDRVQNQVAIYFNNSNLRSTDITISYPVEIRSITAIKENTSGNVFKYGGGSLNGVAIGVGGLNYNTNDNFYVRTSVRDRRD